MTYCKAVELYTSEPFSSLLIFVLLELLLGIRHREKGEPSFLIKIEGTSLNLPLLPVLPLLKYVPNAE